MQGKSPKTARSIAAQNLLKLNIMASLFDSKRDNILTTAGNHFFCMGCLVAVPLEKQSPDPGYCQGCYDFLTKESQQLKVNGSTKRPSWMPVIDKQPPAATVAPPVNDKVNDKEAKTCVTDRDMVKATTLTVVTDKSLKEGYCITCGRLIPEKKRTVSKFCSNRCKQGSYRKRQKELQEVLTC